MDMKINFRFRIAACFLLPALLISALSGCSADVQKSSGTSQRNAYTSLFSKDQILDIRIDVPESDWSNLLENAQSEEYHSASITLNGTSYSQVGLRTKGNSTLRMTTQEDSDRYSFRIKLDKYKDGQNLMGLDEFVLNNCFSDPSYMREYLTYEAMAELGMKTPLTAYANVYVNGKLFGFYLCVEAIDDSYLNRSFGSDVSSLYKANENCTLLPESNLDAFDQKSGQDESKEDLRKLIDTLDAMTIGKKGDIESILDVSSALKYIAACTVLGSYDSYLGDHANNYYLANVNGIFTVIPWDYNMSFGGYAGRGGSSTEIPIDEPVCGVTTDSRPLVSKLLAVPEYLEEYHGYIKTLTDFMAGLENRISSLAEIIRPCIESDPSAFYTIEQFDSSLTYQEQPSTQAQSGSVTNLPQADNPPSSSPQSDTGDAGADDRQGGFREHPDRNGPPGMDGAADDRAPGNMGVSSISLMQYINQRLRNLQLQLSGDLPTTGNTTAVQQSDSPRETGGEIPPGNKDENGMQKHETSGD